MSIDPLELGGCIVKGRKGKRKGTSSGEPELFLNGDQPTIYRKRRIRWTSVLKWGSLALAAILIGLFVWGYIWLKTKESQMRLPGVEEALDTKQGSEPVTTLVMGIDKGSVPGEQGNGRADILMLVSVNPDTSKAAIISIPRDTRCMIPGQSDYGKMNAAYALGGAELTIETVKDFTGLDINHYVVIDFEGFKHIVEAVGGVPMHIENEIDDPYAGYVPAGDVVLDGDQALALVRARYDINSVPAGDLDRIKNQRQFLQAMLSKVAGQRNPLKIKTIIDVASRNIKTDLTFMEMLSLGNRLKGVDSGDVQMTTAPGSSQMVGGTWYYIVDTEQFKQMLTSFESSAEVGEEPKEQVESQGDRANIKLAVLNGSREDGLAATVAGEMEKQGYRDVQTGNSQNSYSVTTIYYSDGNSEMAGTVAADLEGVAEPRLQASDGLTSQYGVEVLVVLGSDYQG